MTESSVPDRSKALICIAGGRIDQKAIAYARSVITALRAKPVLLHVAESMELVAPGKRILSEAAAFFQKQEPERLLLTGHPETAIREELEKGEYCLLILGTAERSHFQPLSPLIKRLATSVDCNVLFIQNPDESLDNILICTAGHPKSMRPVSLGLQIAMSTNSQAIILHVAANPPAMYAGLTKLDQDLSQVLLRDTPLSRHLRAIAFLSEQFGVEAKMQLRHGMVTEEIVRASEMLPHDLIVMGAASETKPFDRLFLGNIAPQVLASVRSSTLIVRQEIEADTTIPAVTAAQMLRVDQLAEKQFNLALMQMMENAGRNLARLSRERFLGGSVERTRVLVLAGTGGNGGGGMAAARRLHNWGAQVAVILASKPDILPALPRHQLSSLEALGIEPFLAPAALPNADLILDALLGYGARGDPREPLAGLIRQANKHMAPILSLDLPSGLNPDTGEPHDPTIRATATMTLALPKVGLLQEPAKPYVGELWLADISIPTELYRRLGIEFPPIFAQDDLMRIF